MRSCNKKQMKCLFILMMFGAFDVKAGENSSAQPQISALQWYNQGVQHYNSQEKIKATASFRKALQKDPWLFPAQKALNQLQYPPPFFMRVPPEIFFSLTALSLLFLFFSLSLSKLIFFCLSLALHFGFSSYRNIPRHTILKETTAHTAPHASSPVLFSLAPGDWVVQRKTSKEWIQIKTSEKTLGWILKN